MSPKEFCAIARRLMQTPAVPYHEHAVRAEAEQICLEAKLDYQRDRFGNLLIRLQTDSKVRPLALAAHLDHPGFEIIHSDSKCTARFLGGVPDSYFQRGIPLRLLPEGIPAKLGKRISKKEKVFEIVRRKTDKIKPEFAVWELPDFEVARRLIHGRACDDLIGVAAILATLIDLKRDRTRVNVIGIISRAEEVGFHGALTIASSRILPKNTLAISLETSRELPGVKMGNGVILRVGDRASIFDSAATRFLSEVGSKLKNARKHFQFQRALMSGGTCEATAYQEYGFQTAAVCVALGNYHNCGERNRIKAEYVSLTDTLNMVDLLATSARQMKNYSKLTTKLPKRLNGLLREAKQKLAISI